MIPTFTKALNVVARVMRDGRRKHPHDDWATLPFQYHASRAAEHLRRLAEGDEAEDHLAHAATRLLLALTLRERSEEQSCPR